MLRRERETEPLVEVEAPATVNFAALDVERILRECKPNDRIVLQEHYIDGYKTAEIAQKRGCSKTAVRIRLLRARRKIHQDLIAANTARPLARTSLGALPLARGSD